MLGIPEQTEQSLLESIDRLCALSPEHISAYGLSIEEGTPFDRMRDRLVLPDEDAAALMYASGVAALKKRGYEQYEISNFAKKGYESRHNLKYWNCEEFLGFGPAAYSDFMGARFGKSRDLSAYIEGRCIEVEREVITRQGRMNEYVMLRMRLADGVSLADFKARFGVSFESVFGARLKELNIGHLLTCTPERIAFTAAGMRVSNAVLAALLDFES